MTRIQVKELDVAKASESVDVWLKKVLSEKGLGTFSSTHEIRGVIDEEVAELKCALGGKVSRNLIEHELKDVAVACIFSLACIQAGTVDW